ncbi:hypothetical protein HPB49_021808 [Dermacentor silvarum]|uniref:Uncharacterized protein n=1 Tax=Dermacentor silvarum TaxID=543639 RepID=A0ACB8E370_DERSI|nr:hypothetical protein HPB49_021808 [Dermacentor silvarum]
MGPRSGRLRESGGHLVGSYPSACPSVNQLFSILRWMRSVMFHPRVDLNKSCTASVVDGCFHLMELSLWKDFLWVINIELRDGRLALACLRGRVVPLPSNVQRSASFILVHWLLMQHRSSEIVELRVSRGPAKQFRSGLELSGNLRHVTLGYHLLGYPPRDLRDELRSTGTALDTLEIMSVRFSSVGLSMLGELLDRCNAMGTVDFLENCIDVREAQAPMR